MWLPLWRFFKLWPKVDFTSRYSLPLATIPEGEYEREFRCDTEFFRAMENDVISGDVSVHLDLTRRGDSYRCLFSFEGKLEIPCDRCLSPMDFPVDTEYPLTIRYGEEYNDETDGVIVVPESTRDFDLSGILYDTILLTLPLRLVHPEGECDAEMEEIIRSHTATEDSESLEEE